MDWLVQRSFKSESFQEHINASYNKAHRALIKFSATQLKFHISCINLSFLSKHSMEPLMLFWTNLCNTLLRLSTVSFIQFFHREWNIFNVLCRTRDTVSSALTNYTVTFYMGAMPTYIICYYYSKAMEVFLFYFCRNYN